MATLIPSIGTSAFDSAGERRLAERLGVKLHSVMIDEGHDFAPEWLKLVTQMVNRATNSLLVLYDDAQSIYERARSKQFSFKSVGKNDDGIPLLKPVSCGREGQAPVIIKLPTLRDEAFAIADHLASAHKEGFAWGDMLGEIWQYSAPIGKL